MEIDFSLLKETEIFKNLTRDQIEKVLTISRRVSFSAGETVMNEGEHGDTMYVIASGSVDVVKSLIRGGIDEEQETGSRNKVFTRLDASDHAVFGEMALLEELQRTATVRAVTGCELLAIKKDDFLQLAEQDYELGYRICMNLSRIVSARLRKADEDTIKLTTALCFILQEP
jgi:CRP/FNR family transcriptional regulator, cyclic AMP receptor protein